MAEIYDNNLNYAESQLVTFNLGDEEFGADIMNVKEIVRVTEIVKVPNAPDYIEGACNLRGDVLPIIDGRARLNMPKKEKDENSRVLVLDVNGTATGVVVDKVSEVLRVNTHDIEETPNIIKSVDSEYLNGIVKLNNGQRLIMLLDVVNVLKVNVDVQERIKDYSAVSTTTNESPIEVSDNHLLVSFLLGKEEFAMDIMQVKEIIRLSEVMKVPNGLPYIEGVVSIRNKLLPIINMRTYFDMAYQPSTDHTRVLVVDMGDFTAGIMVDKVQEVLRIPTDITQPLPKFAQQGGEQIKGVAKINDGKRLIMMLEPKGIISNEQFEIMIESSHNQMGESNEMTNTIIDEEHLVTFYIDTEEYAIKIKDVIEINRMTSVTKVPRSPHYIEGIVNLRGNIITAIDLRRLFGLAEKQINDSTRIIIVESGDTKTGLVVDSVSEVMRIERTKIEEPPVIIRNGINSNWIEGVGKLNNGQRMILILSLNQVLNFQNDC